MDDLGTRLIQDRELVRQKRAKANRLEDEAKRLRREADEIERVSELARLS